MEILYRENVKIKENINIHFEIEPFDELEVQHLRADGAAVARPLSSQWRPLNSPIILVGRPSQLFIRISELFVLCVL